MRYLLTWGLRLLYGVGGLATVGLALLYALQDRLLYVPNLSYPEEILLQLKPERHGLHAEDVHYTTEDGVRIHAWLLTLPEWTPEHIKKRPVIMFFQENAGIMEFRIPFLRLLAGRLNCSVFAISYRGYGMSHGRPSEAGLLRDAKGGLDYLMQRPDLSDKVVLFGRSLGGAVAIHLARERQDQVAALIVENTFTSVEAMAGQLLPFLGYLIGPGRKFNWLVKCKWANIKSIAHINKIPILMLSSSEDEMVPPRHMKELRAAQQSKHCKWVEFPGARHMDAYDSHPVMYWTAVRDFFYEFVEPVTWMGPDGKLVAG